MLNDIYIYYIMNSILSKLNRYTTDNTFHIDFEHSGDNTLKRVFANPIVRQSNSQTTASHLAEYQEQEDAPS
jgi:hypothetical protein